MAPSKRDSRWPMVFGAIWLGFGLWSVLRGESGLIWFGLGAASLLEGLLFGLENRRIVTGRRKAILSFTVAAVLVVVGVGSVLTDVSIRTYVIFFVLALGWLSMGAIVIRQEHRSSDSSTTAPSEAVNSGS